MEEVTLQQTRASFDARVHEVFGERARHTASRTDRMFIALFGLQWVVGVIIAIATSPKTWASNVASVHMHVFAAIFLGGILALTPACAVYLAPGTRFSRLVVATVQMLFSVLLIHLTGGRIEAHFHIFGSLAFLAFYRDWRPVVLATLVTGLDHVVRGALWPESIYGSLHTESWRAFEHIGWVLFEDVFLLIAISSSKMELISSVSAQVELEQTLIAVGMASPRANEQHRAAALAALL